MAIWDRNKVLPSTLNSGNEYVEGDFPTEETLNAANNNAFYSVDFTEALADAPDNTEAGNIGTPTVTLIDNVKTIDGTPKTFKKFKFANLKGEKGDAGINDANVVQDFGTSTEDAISQKVITDKFDELDEQINAVPISDTSYGLIEAFENAEAGVMQDLLLKGYTSTQLLVNGDFSNGVTGWEGFWNSSIVEHFGEYCMQLYNETDNTQHVKQVMNIVAGHKYYVSYQYKLLSGDIIAQGFRIDEPYVNTYYVGYNDTTPDIWHKSSAVLNVGENYSKIYLGQGIVNNQVNILYDKVMVIDLTADFGAGLEPNLATCQTLYPSYFDGTKSVDKGEVSVIGKNLFDTNEWFNFLQTYEVESTYPTSKGNDGTYSYIKAHPYGHFTLQFMKGRFIANTQYVLSFIGKADAISYTGLRVTYTDGTSTTQSITNTNWKQFSIVSTASKTIDYISIYFGNYGYGYFANIQLELGSTATTYAPYNPTRARYPKLQSVPAIQDTFDVLSGLHTQNIQSVATTSGTAINTTNYPLAKNAVGFVIALTAGGTQIGTVGTDSASGDGILYYQLDVPALTYYPPKSIPLEINSSIIHQSIMSDIAFYSTGIAITDTNYPIETLQEVILVNTDDGTETSIDIATCTVASGGLSFTSTALTDGDLVWFRYEHTLDSVVPTTDYTYTTSLAGGLTTIQQDVKKQNESLQKQIDELRAIIASMAV